MMDFVVMNGGRRGSMDMHEQCVQGRTFVSCFRTKKMSDGCWDWKERLADITRDYSKGEDRQKTMTARCHGDRRVWESNGDVVHGVNRSGCRRIRFLFRHGESAGSDSRLAREVPCWKMQGRCSESERKDVDSILSMTSKKDSRSRDSGSRGVFHREKKGSGCPTNAGSNIRFLFPHGENVGSDSGSTGEVRGLGWNMSRVVCQAKAHSRALQAASNMCFLLPYEENV